MSEAQALTAVQQKLSDLWDAHVRAEFSAHAADEAIATMVENPRVNQVPVLIGGDGGEEVYDFYAKHFLHQIPPDMEFGSVSRTIGQGRVVEEMVARFTHTIRMDGSCPASCQRGNESKSGLWWLCSSRATSWRSNTCTGTRRQCWCS